MKVNTKKATDNQEFLKVTSKSVSNVRAVDSKNGALVYFTLEINGVQINSCRVASGKNGDFISFPQYKGSNDKWYSYVWAKLSDEDSAEILEMIQKELDNQ